MDAKGYDIKDWHNYKGDKRTLLNNCVEPKLGLHILKCAMGIITKSNTNQESLF